MNKQDQRATLLFGASDDFDTLGSDIENVGSLTYLLSTAEGLDGDVRQGLRALAGMLAALAGRAEMKGEFYLSERNKLVEV